MNKVALFIVILMILAAFPGTSHAYWYIVSESGKVVAKCDYQPSLTDIASRNELAIWSDEDIKLSNAEYNSNKKIKKHKKTTNELKAEAIKEEKATEEAYVRKELRNMAIERLKEKGHTFKHVEER